jgi:hypothetical protein
MEEGSHGQLIQQLPGKDEKTTKIFSQNNQPPGRDLNRVSAG